MLRFAAPDPDDRPGDVLRLGRDPLHVTEARSVGIRPEEDVHRRQRKGASRHGMVAAPVTVPHGRNALDIT